MKRNTKILIIAVICLSIIILMLALLRGCKDRSNENGIDASVNTENSESASDTSTDEASKDEAISEESDSDKHTHAYGDTWTSNETDHWKECKCGEKSNTASHTFGDWVTTKEALCKDTGIKKHQCTVCGYSETATIPVVAHTYGEWKKNDSNHWKECRCGIVTKKANHTYTSVVTPPTETEQGYTTHTCGVCAYSYIDSYTAPVPSYSEGLKYWVINGAIRIDDIGDCTDVNLKIPPEIEGYKVEKIAYYAFYQNPDLISVTIPDSVTSIGSVAFGYCANLTSVTIGNGVTTVGLSAFSDCTSLTDVTIGNSITKISNHMFNGCTSLTDIVIPNSVTTIGNVAFANCTSLTSIVIPDSVTTIGDNVFSGCTALTDVYYTGSQSDWEKITIGTSNTCLQNATIHYNYGN